MSEDQSVEVLALNDLLQDDLTESKERHGPGIPENRFSISPPAHTFPMPLHRPPISLLVPRSPRMSYMSRPLEFF